MKKKIKVILVILSILLIIMLIMIKFVNQIQNKTNEDKINQELRKEKTREYFSDKMLPQGVASLYGKYKGQNSKNDLYRNFNNLVQYLPDLYSDIKGMDETKLSAYFEREYLNIKKYLGIEDKEVFERFARYIQNTNLENVTFNSAEIDDTTYENADEYLTFNLELIYNGIENSVRVKVSFANLSTANPMVVYDIAKD